MWIEAGKSSISLRKRFGFALQSYELSGKIPNENHAITRIEKI